MGAGDRPRGPRPARDEDARRSRRRPIEFGAPPNSLTDPLVLGMPGTLPVFNRAALELALTPRRRDRVEDPREVAVRAQALLLSRPAEGLPDLAVRRAAVRGRPPRSDPRRRGQARAARAHPPRGGRGQEHARRRSSRTSISTARACRSSRSSPRPSSTSAEEAAEFMRALQPARALARDLRGRHGEGPDALRRERVACACAARIASARAPS